MKNMIFPYHPLFQDSINNNDDDISLALLSLQ